MAVKVKFVECSQNALHSCIAKCLQSHLIKARNYHYLLHNNPHEHGSENGFCSDEVSCTCCEVRDAQQDEQ